jgi:methionyl-tRNA formyltransferase
VVAAYGLILPQAMLDAPRRGCLNIHASLLPRWRGAAPIQAAILAGDAQTGVTIMQMDAGLDTGPMLLREAVPIQADTTAATMHDVLAELGARLILLTLADDPLAVPQPAEGVTYAPKLTRDDARIDWSRDAAVIERQVRAFDPWPGTFTTLHGAILKVLRVALADGTGAPGTVLDGGLTVACGAGALRLVRVQLAGRPAMAAEDFLRGRSVPAGTLLGV